MTDEKLIARLRAHDPPPADADFDEVRRRRRVRARRRRVRHVMTVAAVMVLLAASVTRLGGGPGDGADDLRVATGQPATQPDPQPFDAPAGQHAVVTPGLSLAAFGAGTALAYNGHVWVGGFQWSGDRTIVNGLAVVDPATGNSRHIEDRTIVRRLAAGEGFVLAIGNDPDEGRARLLRIDAATLDVEAVDLGDDLSIPGAVAVGHGSVWVATLKKLLRLDLQSLEVTDRIDLGFAPFAAEILVDHGRVWLVSGVPELLEIDVLSNKVTRRTTLHDSNISSPSAVVGFGSIWVLHGDGTLERVDRTTLAVTTTLDLGSDGCCIVATPTGIYAARTWADPRTRTPPLKYVDPTRDALVDLPEITEDVAGLTAAGGKVVVVSGNSTDRDPAGTRLTLHVLDDVPR